MCIQPLTELYSILAKSGAIISSVGTGLLVVFVVVLVMFPVSRDCVSKCSYTSLAPDPLGQLIKPSVLALALVIIATGIVMIRFSRWHEHKKMKA